MSSANSSPYSCHQLIYGLIHVISYHCIITMSQPWIFLSFVIVSGEISSGLPTSWITTSHCSNLSPCRCMFNRESSGHQLTSWIAFPTLTLMTLMSLTRSSHIHMSVMLMQLDWKSKPWVLCHAAPKTLSSPVVVSNYVQYSLMVDLPVLTSLAQFISLTRNPVDHGKTNSSFISYIVFVMYLHLHRTPLLLLHLQPKIPISRHPDLTPTKFRGINTFTALHNVIMSTAQHVPAKMILDSGAVISE